MAHFRQIFQNELENKVSTFLVTVGENKLSEFSPGICNAWAFMNFANDALDQNNANIIRMQKLLEQNVVHLGGLYNEYKSAYTRLIESNGDDEMSQFNRKLRDLSQTITKLRDEKDEKNRSVIQLFEQNERDLRHERSQLIHEALTKKFGADKIQEMYEAEELYVYINTLYDAFYPAAKLGYYVEKGKEKYRVNQNNYFEIFKLIHEAYSQDEKEYKLPVEKVFDVCFSFTYEELVKLFKIPGLIRDGDMIQLGSTDHAIYLSYKNGNYTLYNPGPIPIKDNKPENLVNAIQSAFYTIFGRNADYMPIEIIISAKTNASNLSRPLGVEIIREILNEREKNGRLNIDATAWDGATAIMIAARTGRTDIIQLLLEKKCNTNIPDRDGHTPLTVAIANGYTDVVDLLVKHDKKSLISHGVDPLNIAARNGDIVLINKLLEYKVNIQPENKEGLLTAAHAAAECGQAEALKTLIEQKADLESRDSNGDRPLEVAIKNDHINVIQMIIKLNRRSIKKNYLFGIATYAASCGHLNIINFLVKEYGISVNDTDGNGYTLAMFAAQFGQNELVKKLIDIKADLMKINISGLSALQYAINTGRAQVAETILSNMSEQDRKRSLDSGDGEGSTPLHIAMMRRDFVLVQLLIDKGASLEMSNKHGVKPVDVLNWPVEQTYAYLQKHAAVYNFNQLYFIKSNWDIGTQAIKGLVSNQFKKHQKSNDDSLRFFQKSTISSDVKSDEKVDITKQAIDICNQFISSHPSNYYMVHSLIKKLEENKEYATIVTGFYHLGMNDNAFVYSLVLNETLDMSNFVLNTCKGLKKYNLLNPHVESVIILYAVPETKQIGYKKLELLNSIVHRLEVLKSKDSDNLIAQACQHLLNTGCFNGLIYKKLTDHLFPTPKDPLLAKTIASSINSLAEKDVLSFLNEEQIKKIWNIKDPGAVEQVFKQIREEIEQRNPSPPMSQSFNR